MNIVVSAFLPFFRTLRDYYEERPQDVLLERRSNFIGSLDAFLMARDTSIRRVTTEYARPPDAIATLLSQNSFFNNLPIVDHLRINVEVEVDVEFLKGINKTDQLEESFIEAIAATTVSEALEDALLLSELALPGCIHVLDGLVSVKNSTHPILKKDSFLSLHFPEDSAPKWPPLGALSMLDTLAWAKRLGFRKECFASSRVSRALAAFTHIVGLGRRYEGEVLFRAMQGLEAFYCDGNGDLRRQLAEKIKIWVGPWSDKKNVVGQLYDVRSAFVHGSSPLEYFGDQGDAWSENEKAKTEGVFAKTFAVRLLIGTLQKCVVNDIADLGWTFNVDVRK